MAAMAMAVRVEAMEVDAAMDLGKGTREGRVLALTWRCKDLIQWIG